MSNYEELLARLDFLESRLVQLEEENQSLRLDNESLRTENQHLREQLNLNSRTSSKPPSSDRASERKSNRKKSSLKVGGQPNHTGKTLLLSSTPDQTFIHRPASCTCCGTSLADVPNIAKPERRQIVDLPEVLRLSVSEHQGHHLVCPHCKTKNHAPFPPEARTRIQYGSRLVGLVQTLHHAHAIPYLRGAQLVSGIFGGGPCAATLVNASRFLDQVVLSSNSQELLAQVKTAEVLRVDESGVLVEGELLWVHVASTEQACYMKLDKHRGLAAMEHLMDYTGILLHDGWQSYQLLNQALHALCNAHHLRDFIFCHEIRQCPWAEQFILLLLTSYQAVQTAKSEGLTCLPPEQIQAITEQYQALVAQGLAEHPPPQPPTTPKPGRLRKSKERNLLERMQKYQDQVLRFLTNFSVPFDNNLAERDIRMLKVVQKIFGCFRKLWGAQAHLNIRSFFLTKQRAGENALNAITNAITQHWISTSA